MLEKGQDKKVIELGEKAIPALVWIILHGKDQPRERIKRVEPAPVKSDQKIKHNATLEAVILIMEIGPSPAIPLLIQGLKNASPSVRARAARGLALVGDASAVPALVHALASEHPTVRMNAAEALGCLFISHIDDCDRVAAVSALVQIFENDGDRRVRMQAARAVSNTTCAGVTCTLIRALDDADPNIRILVSNLLVKQVSSIESDLSLVQKTLEGFVNGRRKAGDPAIIKEAEKEASEHYIKIAEAFRKSKNRVLICADGEMLEARLKPPKSRRDSGMFRIQTSNRPLAPRLVRGAG